PEGASDHRQLDVDVPLGRPGVGAAAVGLGDQVLDLVAGQVGDGDPQLDGQPVPALGGLGQGDQGGGGRPGARAAVSRAVVAGQVGDGDPQLDGQPVPALGVLGQADQGGDGRPGRVEVDLVDPGHAGQGVVEAGGVAGGEQLLGIGALAGAADLLGRGDLDVDGAGGRRGCAVLAAAGGGGFGGVEHVHGVLLGRGPGPRVQHA